MQLTGKITGIDPNGEFSNKYGAFNKYRVTMATGLVYNFLAKGEFSHKIGEEIQFEVTNEQYNSAKVIQEQKPAFKPQVSGSKDDVQKYIIRQSSAATAARYLSESANAGRDIIELAREIEQYVYNG
jgi:hypothetical protein